jgi:WD40 repeat protein
MSTPLVLQGQTLRTGNQVIVDENRSVAFEIHSIIGEGGMGIVYRAIQDYPSRTVALKALKGTLVESALLHRFEREVNILALLRHPGICQLYCAGTLHDGLGVKVPFLAMEIVQGLPIHQHCRKHRLTIRQKLELFLKVADAIEYVHTTGIVHRDITCRNVLVNDRGEPKVLDFGLANFCDHRQQLYSVATVTGQPFGTLQYTSPEQANGQVHEIDRQTDVYALGAMLYKLLSGLHPIKLAHLTTAEAVQRIQEYEPDRLSKRSKKLQGDLETIVHKAMCKLKGGRYRSVSALATDIRHYLANEPIGARPPSARYLASKFIKRHRALVVTAVVVILSLSIGMAAAMHQAFRARNEAARASSEANRANSEASRANAEARRAAVRLAEAKVAQGDAYFAAERFPEARASYNAAWDVFERVGESSRSAQLGIWEVDQYCARPIRQVMATSNGVERAAISQDQQWLAISRDGLVAIRELLTNRLHAQFQLKGVAAELLFSPNGQFVAGRTQGQFIVWDVCANQCALSLDGVVSEISCTALSDRQVAIAGARGEVLMRDLGPKREERSIQIQRPIRKMVLTKGGKLVAIDADWGVWTRDGSGSELLLIGSIPNAVSKKRAKHLLAISPEGRFVATFDADGAVVFSVPDLKEVVKLPEHGFAHSAGFAGETAVFVGGEKRDRYKILGLDGQLRLIVPQDSLGSAVFSEDLAATWNLNRPLVLWSTARSPGLKAIDLPAIPLAGTLSKDGSIAAIGGKDGLIRIHDAVKGNALRTLDATAPLKILKLDDAANLLVAVTQDDRTGTMDSLIQFWDLKTFQKITEIRESGPVQSFALAGSGSLALSCVFNTNSIRVWDRNQAGWKSKTFDVEFPVASIDLAPDLKTFVITSDVRDVEVWSLQPPRRRAVLAQSIGFSDAAFTRDGGSIVARSRSDKSLGVWKLEKSVPKLLQFSKIPATFDTSTHNDVVLSNGGNLEFLGLESWRIDRHLSAPTVAPRVLSMSADGNRVLVADRQGHAIFIDLGVPSKLRDDIDGKSRSEKAQWFDTCGLPVAESKKAD